VDWDETLERVRAAAEFCASAGLVRFRIDEERFAIDIRRTERPAPFVAAAAEGPFAVDAPLVSNGVAVVDEAPATVVKAEFVGIVRFSRPTVARGTSLPEDRELAYVESLGIRNPVRSGGPGRVAAVYVSDGEAVGYGQPLFAIEA
jgi:acetyl-CoA carboxylase biotin carboxyl carrier protein